MDVKSASRSNSGSVPCVVLAAGAGTCFAGQKQLARLGGRRILERPLEARRAAAGLKRTILVLELSRVAKVACDEVADPLDADLPADLDLNAARLRRG